MTGENDGNRHAGLCEVDIPLPSGIQYRKRTQSVPRRGNQ